jgi:hypothetical protein
MRVGRPKLLLPLPALLGLTASITSRALEKPPAFQWVDLQALGDFNLDPANGTIDDVPAKFRKLDGQRVALDGFMWSPLASARLSNFQFVYTVQPKHRPPLVQDRVFAHIPNGKKLPYVDRYLRLFGTLHVNVKHEDGVITSVFTLDVDHAEPPAPVPLSVALSDFLKNDRLIILDAITFFLVCATATNFIVTGFGGLVRESRAYHWRERGQCPHCGYDLRASAGRCPECGH